MAEAARDLAEQHDAEALAEATHQAARDRRNEPDRWPVGSSGAAEARYVLTPAGWAAVHRSRRAEERPQ